MSQSLAWDTMCFALSSSSCSPRAGLSTMPCTAGGKPSTSFVLVSHCAWRTPANTRQGDLSQRTALLPSNPSHSRCDPGCLAADGAGQGSSQRVFYTLSEENPWQEQGVLGEGQRGVWYLPACGHPGGRCSSRAPCTAASPRSAAPASARGRASPAARAGSAAGPGRARSAAAPRT